MRSILFEDRKIKDLYPACLARPAAMISCGGYRLEEIIQSLNLPTIHVPRPHLSGTIPEVDRHVSSGVDKSDDDYLLFYNFINGTSNNTKTSYFFMWVVVKVRPS